MNSQLPSAIILFVLLLAFCCHAFAVENETHSGTITLLPTQTGYLLSQGVDVAYADYGVLIDPLSSRSVAAELRTSPDVVVNGHSIASQAQVVLVGGQHYVSAAPVLSALFPDITLSLQAGRLTAVQGETFSFEATAGKGYFMVNDRYFYLPSYVISREDETDLLLQADILARALGCSSVWKDEDSTLVIKQVGYPVRAGIYDEEDLFWLSHIIYAESGNQPMSGRLAVGNVILNRVADPTFPSTVYDVIFQENQFSPVSNGTIYLEPDEDSLVAAKLCLDGVNVAEDCLYFNVTNMVSWADRNRTYVSTIGDHKFYL